MGAVFSSEIRLCSHDTHALGLQTASQDFGSGVVPRGRKNESGASKGSSAGDRNRSWRSRDGLPMIADLEMGGAWNGVDPS